MESESNFDVSELSYEDFILYFLTNTKDDFWQRDPHGNEFSFGHYKRPNIIVRYLTMFCSDFQQLSTRMDLATLDRGIKGMLSPAFFELESTLWDEKVDLEESVSCIRSMYRVFADFVASCTIEVLENCFYMWWDAICDSFWTRQRYEKKLEREDYHLLSDRDKKIADAMFETLVEILKLNDDRCKSAALHGLGHLQHPGVRKVVQVFIDEHRGRLDKDALSWLEQCRDGTVM